LPKSNYFKAGKIGRVFGLGERLSISAFQQESKEKLSNRKAFYFDKTNK